METYQQKKDRLAKSKEVAAKANPGKAIFLKAGEGRDKKYFDQRKKINQEKINKTSTSIERVKSDEINQVGELYKKGFTVDQIAEKTGIPKFNVPYRIRLFKNQSLIK